MNSTNPIRQGTRIVLTGLILLVAASAASARTVADPVSAERIVQALERSVWITDGADSGRHVYILYSTACGWCRTLYSETRDRDDGVQFRWVLHAGVDNGAGYVVETGTVQAIGEAFEGRVPAPADPEQALRLLDNNTWLSQIIGGQLAYPTFIYTGTSGLQVAVGARGDLSSLLVGVIERPGSADSAPNGLPPHLTAKPSVQPADISRFINFSQQILPLHAQPSLDAMRVGEVEPMGMFDTVHGFVGDDWIVVTGLRTLDGGARDIHAYIHAPEAIALARLEFDVAPARGAVVAETVTRPVHSHPTRRSPVIDELPPGYQLNRVGEVSFEGETWDVVVFFDDGTHAYLPR